MEALPGFKIGYRNYAAFAAIFAVVLGGIGAAVFILGLPGRIAIAHGHPEAEAACLMGWIGLSCTR